MPNIPDFSAPTIGSRIGASPEHIAGGVAPVQSDVPRRLAEQGQAGMALGSAISRVAEQIQNETDEAVANESDSMFAEALGKRLIGFRSKLGADADAMARQQLTTDMQSAYRDLSKNLTNPVQRRLFDARATRRLAQAGLEADEHFAKQTRARAIGAGEVAVQTTTKDILSAFQRGDADEVRTKFAELRARADHLNELGGGDATQAAAMRLGATTDAHLAIAQSLVTEGDPEWAAQYLKTNSDEIDPLRMLKAQAEVNRAIEAQRRSDDAENDQQIALKTALDLDALPSLEARNKANDDLFRSGSMTAKQHQMVAALIGQRQSVRFDAESKARTSLLSAMRSEFDNNRAQAEHGRADLIGFEGLPSAMQQQLSDNGLRGAAEQYAAHERYVTTTNGWWWLQQIDENPGMLRGMERDMFDYVARPMLDDNYYGHALDLWKIANGEKPSRGAGTGAGSSGAGGAGGFFLQSPERLARTISDKLFGAMPEHPSSEELLERGEKEMQVDQEIRLQMPEGKQPTREDYEQYLAEQLMRKIHLGGTGGREVLLAAATPEQRRDAWVTTVGANGEQVSVALAEVRDLKVRGEVEQRMREAIAVAEDPITSTRESRSYAQQLRIALNTSGDYERAMFLLNAKRADAERETNKQAALTNAEQLRRFEAQSRAAAFAEMLRTESDPAKRSNLAYLSNVDKYLQSDDAATRTLALQSLGERDQVLKQFATETGRINELSGMLAGRLPAFDALQENLSVLPYLSPEAQRFKAKELETQAQDVWRLFYMRQWAQARGQSVGNDGILRAIDDARSSRNLAGLEQLQQWMAQADAVKAGQMPATPASWNWPSTWGLPAIEPDATFPSWREHDERIRRQIDSAIPLPMSPTPDESRNPLPVEPRDAGVLNEERIRRQVENAYPPTKSSAQRRAEFVQGAMDKIRKQLGSVR